MSDKDFDQGRRVAQQELCKRYGFVNIRELRDFLDEVTSAEIDAWRASRRQRVGVWRA